MKKKLLASLLALCLVFSLLPASVLADGEDAGTGTGVTTPVTGGGEETGGGSSGGGGGGTGSTTDSADTEDPTPTPAPDTNGVITVSTVDDLRAALANENVKTVKLGSNIEATNVVDNKSPTGYKNNSTAFLVTRTVTLDLNGYTLDNKCSSGGYTIAVNTYDVSKGTDYVDDPATLTIINSGSEAAAIVRGTSKNSTTIDVLGAYLVLGDGTHDNFTVDCTQDNTGTDHSVIKVETVGEVTINGGTVGSAKASSDEDARYARSIQNYGKLTVNGGTIKSRVQVWSAQWNNTHGSLVINGGTFEADVYITSNVGVNYNTYPLNGTIEIPAASTAVIKGTLGVITTGTPTAEQAKGTVKVAGGTINEVSAPCCELTVTGDTFSSDPSEYLNVATHKATQAASDGKVVYKVEETKGLTGEKKTDKGAVTITLTGDAGKNQAEAIAESKTEVEDALANGGNVSKTAITVNAADSDNGDKVDVTVEIPAETAATLTGKQITLKANKGVQVILPSTAVNKIADAEDAVEITVKAADAEAEGGIAYTISAEIPPATEGGEPTNLLPEGEKNGTITITVPAPEDAEKAYVYYKVDGKLIEEIEAKLNNNKVTFTTTHLSEYVVTATKQKVLIQIGQGDISGAILNQSNDEVKDIKVTAAAGKEKDGVIPVKITTNTPIPEHKNEDSTPADGYWVGFAIAAPDGAAKVKYSFGNTKKTAADLDNVEAKSLELNVTTDKKSGIAFYADVGAASPNKYAVVQWIAAEDDVEATAAADTDESGDKYRDSEVYIYEMDLSGVKLADVDDQPVKTRGKGPAVGVTGENYDYAKAYSDLGLSFNEKTKTISGRVKPKGAETALVHKIDDQNYIYYGIEFTAPDDAAKVAVADSMSALKNVDLQTPTPQADDGDEAETKYDLYDLSKNDEEHVLNNQYIEYFPVAKCTVEGETVTATDGFGANSFTYFFKWFKEDGTVLKTTTATINRKAITVGNGSSSSSGGGSSAANVTVPGATGGEVSVSDSNAKKGDTVTITATPDTGKVVDTVTVTDADGNKIDVTDVGDGTYTFVMPDGKVPYDVTFADDTTAGKIVFTDVPAGAYYSDAVAWAVEKGITNGTGANTFSPGAPCTRAQIVTFLWRAAGSPKATGANPFTDVKETDYFYDAVLWAVEKGITNGDGDKTFSPAKTCTRGQTVTFLYRYAGQPETAGSNPFADVAEGEYYTSAVLWAVEKGITNGTGAGTFSPANTCTRGEIVTFLYRDLAE